MPKNRTTGQARGFAFVEFDARNSVMRGLEYDQPLAINGGRFLLQECKGQDGRHYKRRVAIVVIQPRRSISLQQDRS